MHERLNGPSVRCALCLVVAMALTGCGKDEGLAEFAKEANRQQAQQNQEMAKMNREVAAASKSVVSVSAEATNKLLTLEKKFDNQRQAVNAERRELAQERKGDSMLGGFLLSAAELIAVSLPLVLAWYLLAALQSQAEPGISALLITELDRSMSNRTALSVPAPANAPTRLEE